MSTEDEALDMFEALEEAITPFSVDDFLRNICFDIDLALTEDPASYVPMAQMILTDMLTEGARKEASLMFRSALDLLQRPEVEDRNEGIALAIRIGALKLGVEIP